VKGNVTAPIFDCVAKAKHSSSWTSLVCPLWSDQKHLCFSFLGLTGPEF